MEEKCKNEQYEIEIKNLRAVNTELKIKLSNVNEEAHILELSKLNILIALKEKDNNLINKDNNSLREQFISFEKHLKSIIDENHKYCKIIENKVNIL